MSESIENLLKEYKELTKAMNEMLLRHKLEVETLGELPNKSLQEFSRMNKRLFEINEKLIEILKSKRE